MIIITINIIVILQQGDLFSCSANYRSDLATYFTFIQACNLEFIVMPDNLL